MRVAMHHQRSSTFTLTLSDDLPESIAKQIIDLTDQDKGAGAVGATVVITDQRIDPDAMDDDSCLDASVYTGVITKPSTWPMVLVGKGLGSELDTALDADVTLSAASLTSIVNTFRTNDLTAGTVGTATAVTHKFPAYITTHRMALDYSMELAGAEYYINPDGSIDADDAETLFGATPDLVVTRKPEGADTDYRGVEGGILRQTIDLEPMATKIGVLVEGTGRATQTVLSTQSTNRKTWKGNTWDMCRVLSTPATDVDNKATVASDALALMTQRREIKVSARTHNLPSGVAIPGKYIYVFDVPAGLYDSSNVIEHRGDTITPVKVRLLAVNGRIGQYAYIRPNGSSPTWIDVSNYVVWPEGDTQWTVGEWSPSGFSRVNRTSPDVETRLSEGDYGAQRFLAEDGTVGAPAFAFLDDTNVGWYRYAADKWAWAANSTIAVRLGTGDATATDGTGIIITGVDGGDQVAIDTNEIMWRDNGVQHNTIFQDSITNPTNDMSIRATGAGKDLILDGDTEVQMQIDGSTKVRVKDDHLEDDNSRQFIRTDTGRTSVQVVQFGTVSGTTDGSGDLSVTFTEAFTSTPFVVVSRSDVGQIRRHTVTTTGFKVGFDDSSGTAQTSVSKAASWIAIGAKTNT